MFSDNTLLIPLYNHPNKLATHHVDRHRNQFRAYNFDVQFVKGTIATKRDERRQANMGQTEGVGAIQVLCKPFLVHSRPPPPVSQCKKLADPLPPPYAYVILE